MSLFDFSYWREPLDPAAPFYRRKRYGPWEIADVDGNWTVVMNGIDAATVARLVEVPGPSFRYYELREPGLTSTYMRWVETYDPEGPPEPLYTYWVDGEWRTGPLPSENELAMLRRIPPPGHPPRLLTREQKDLWDSGCPIVPIIRDETNTPGFQVLSFGWVCQLEGIPIPDADLILAEVALEDERAQAYHASKRRRIEEAEAAIEAIRRRRPDDPVEFQSEYERLAKQVPAKGSIPDELWFEAVQALASWFGSPPSKMALDTAILALGESPCGGPRPDESRLLRAA